MSRDPTRASPPDPGDPIDPGPPPDAEDPPLRSRAEIAAALSLRPKRPPVARLSRKAIIALIGGSSLAIAAALALALHGPSPPAAPKELYTLAHGPTADGLTRLPKDYRGLTAREDAADPPVPALGPPLPGDLGRPMLKAAGAARAVGAEGGADPPTAPDHEAAQSSGLFIARAATAAGALDHGPGAAAADAAPRDANPSAETDHGAAVLKGEAAQPAASRERLQPPASAYSLQAGAVIAAALVTGLRSDLPGPVVAQVTEDVFDSPTGRIRLIPQGTRLIGQYDAQVTFGQRRAQLAWTRLILPDGRSLALDRQPAADAQGYAGLEDQVDNHWGPLFKAAALSTLLSLGAEAGTTSNDNGLVNALRQGASDSMSQVGRQVVGRSLSVQPTLTLRPGLPVRVLVTRDLVLAPWPRDGDDRETSAQAGGPGG